MDGKIKAIFWGNKMNNQHLEGNPMLRQLTELVNKYTLNNVQADQLNRYLQLLIEWNKKFNLTAITDPVSILHYHFDDSLSLAQYIDFTNIHSVADIGTGAGFPAIPLKILFPHLKVILIEVNNKKRTFLAHVIQELNLDNITLYPHDWRTFLRSTEYTVDYFFARASLQPDELVRIFKPASPFKNATLVYWASKQWVAQKIEAPFLSQEITYTIDTVQRKFIFFKQKK